MNGQLRYPSILGQRASFWEKPAAILRILDNFERTAFFSDKSRLNEKRRDFFKRIESYVKSRNEGHGNDLAGELEVSGIMKILISRFLPDIYPDDSIVPFLDIIEYIDKNIERDISVEELADICSLNKIYFSNKFARHMGISPSQFVINRRLEKAMELIGEVAPFYKKTFLGL